MTENKWLPEKNWHIIDREDNSIFRNKKRAEELSEKYGKNFAVVKVLGQFVPKEFIEGIKCSNVS